MALSAALHRAHYPTTYDPIVLAHARALLTPTTTDGVTDYLDADVRDPDRILTGAGNILNFGEPIAVMLLGILGHAAETAEQMHSITSRLIRTYVILRL